MFEGDTVELVCTSPDNRLIAWERLDRMSITDELVFMITGRLGRSTLRINDVRVMNAGEYICRVGQATASYELEIIEGISMFEREGEGDGGEGRERREEKESF